MTGSDHQTPARSRFTLQARLRSFGYAGRGLCSLVQDEHNAWLHLAATVTVVASGLALQISLEDWRWLVVAIGLVWAAEAINTAIEELCDHVCAERDSQIGRVKDLAAGGVLAASIAAAGIGLLTLGPPLAAVFHSFAARLGG